MNKQIKHITVDKYLQPIRKQIVNLVQPNSDVLDFGCGNGDLLFMLSKKIKNGTGFDNSKALISIANKRKATENINNVDFQLVDLTKKHFSNINVNYSIASLFLHVIPTKNAIILLRQMIKTSDIIIVCGFCKPENWIQKTLLFFDQRFTHHYTNFVMYKKNNYVEGLLMSLDNISHKSYKTFDSTIKLYKITKLVN